MSDTTVVLIHPHPLGLAQLQQGLQDCGYHAVLQRWQDDVAATIARAQPAAVVLTLPGDCAPEQEWTVFAALREGPRGHALPVLVCSDRPAQLQRAVGALKGRPGLVLASSCSVGEVLAKLHGVCVTTLPRQGPPSRGRVETAPGVREPGLLRFPVAGRLVMGRG